MARRRKRRRRSRRLGEVSIARACPREGLRVQFNPNPASYMLYSQGYGLPKRGGRGTVTSLSLGSRRTTCLKGPGGGLVYVDWDDVGTMGVSSFDIDRVKR